MATMAHTKRVSCPFLHSVLFRPSVDWMMPMRVRDYMRVIFPQSTYSNAHLFEKHSQRLTQRVCFTSLAKLMQKIKHHGEVTWLKFKLTCISFPLRISSTTPIHPHPITSTHYMWFRWINCVPEVSLSTCLRDPIPCHLKYISSSNSHRFPTLYFPLFCIILDSRKHRHKYTSGL